MSTFLSDVLKFDIRSSGILSIFPYFSLFLFTILFGKLFNSLESKDHKINLIITSFTIKQWERGYVRKVSMIIAYIVSSFFLLFCGFPINRYVSVLMLVISQVIKFFISIFQLSIHNCTRVC